MTTAKSHSLGRLALYNQAQQALHTINADNLTLFASNSSVSWLHGIKSNGVLTQCTVRVVLGETLVSPPKSADALSRFVRNRLPALTLRCNDYFLYAPQCDEATDTDVPHVVCKYLGITDASIMDAVDDVDNIAYDDDSIYVTTAATRGKLRAAVIKFTLRDNTWHMEKHEEVPIFVGMFAACQSAIPLYQFVEAAQNSKMRSASTPLYDSSYATRFKRVDRARAMTQ